MSSSPLLSAHNLTCIREERILFEHLSFDVNPGDIIQVEGPNGAGKTSLLRILAGLSQPYEGHIKFLDQNIQDDRETYHQNMLYLGHKAGVKDELTAAENLEFNLAMHGLDVNEADHTLQQVNLLGFEDAFATQLSAGQHRRISLARLWQSQHKVWMLDEPFTAIDKTGVTKLEAMFLQHADEGGCVILTTHQDLILCAERVKKLKLEYRFF